MAKNTDKLISSGERIMISAEDKFKSTVLIAEKLLLAEIEQLFGVVDVSGGKLQSNEKTTEFLASLEARIYRALNKSGYNDGVTKFLKNFDAVKLNNIDLQEVLNGEIILPSALNQITRLETQTTINKLLGSGISRDFIVPIQQSLYRNIILGADVNDAKKTIQDYILTNDGADSKLLKYTTQVARDSINQYDGAIQKTIANELDLSDYLYAGSLILDSRGQCRYWVEKTRLKGDELKDEINAALNGSTLGGYKCSGMIPETSVDTFSVYRGGYNCRHRAIATNFV